MLEIPEQQLRESEIPARRRRIGRQAERPGQARQGPFRFALVLKNGAQVGERVGGIRVRLDDRLEFALGARVPAQRAQRAGKIDPRVLVARVPGESLLEAGERFAEPSPAIEREAQIIARLIEIGLELERLPERLFGRRIVLELHAGEAQPVQGLRMPGALRQRRHELRFGGGGIPLLQGDPAERAMRNRQLEARLGKYGRMDQSLLEKLPGLLEQPQVAAQHAQEIQHLAVAPIGRMQALIDLRRFVEPARRVMPDGGREIRPGGAPGAPHPLARLPDRGVQGPPRSGGRGRDSQTA